MNKEVFSLSIKKEGRDEFRITAHFGGGYTDELPEISQALAQYLTAVLNNPIAKMNNRVIVDIYTDELPEISQALAQYLTAVLNNPIAKMNTRVIVDILGTAIEIVKFQNPPFASDMRTLAIIINKKKSIAC